MNPLNKKLTLSTDNIFRAFATLLFNPVSDTSIDVDDSDNELEIKDLNTENWDTDYQWSDNWFFYNLFNWHREEDHSSLSQIENRLRQESSEVSQVIRHVLNFKRLRTTCALDYHIELARAVCDPTVVNAVALQNAIMLDWLPGVKRILEADPALAYCVCTETGIANSPLTAAAWYFHGNYSIIQYLLSLQVDINQQAKEHILYDKSALSLAVIDQHDVALTRYLLEQGAKASACVTYHFREQTGNVLDALANHNTFKICHSVLLEEYRALIRLLIPAMIREDISLAELQRTQANINRVSLSIWPTEMTDLAVYYAQIMNGTQLIPMRYSPARFDVYAHTFMRCLEALSAMQLASEGWLRTQLQFAVIIRDVASTESNYAMVRSFSLFSAIAPVKASLEAAKIEVVDEDNDYDFADDVDYVEVDSSEIPKSFTCR